MKRQCPGWNILIFIILISLGMLIATNCFKIAVHLRTISRLRYRHHQSKRLLEGLLVYGINVCSENRNNLFSWGMLKPQSMLLKFDRWPHAMPEKKGDCCSGLLAIHSYAGVLHLKAELYCKNNLTMSASCDMKPCDVKNLKGEICVANWLVH